MTRMQTSFLKRIRTHIKPIGLGVLFTAAFLLLWWHSASEEIELFVPVELENMPGSLALTHMPIKGVEVKVKGPKYLVKTLYGLKHPYVIDLAPMIRGTNRIEFEKRNFSFPEGVVVSDVSPPTVTLDADRAVKKEVPVMVSVSGKPAKGFVLSDAVSRPPSVLLKGPESALSRIEKAMTKTIDINGISESLRKEIALNIDEILTIESEKSTFMADIFIEEQIASKAFDAISVDGVHSALAYDITPPTIDIEIEGAMNILERIDPSTDIQAYVDLEGLSPGVYARPVIINLPLKTTLVSVNPEIFTVTVK